MEFARLEWLWASSWQAAALVPMVLLVQRGIAPWVNARWRCALWWVIAAKLLVPVTVPLPVSLYPDWFSASEDAPSTPAALDSTRGAGPGLGLEIVVPRVALGRDASGTEEGSDGGDAGRKPLALESREESTPEPLAKEWWRPWIFWIWASGMMTGLAWHALGGLRIYRRSRMAKAPVDGRLQRLVDWCRNEMGIRREVNVVIVEWLRGPAIFGWRRPMILLPSAMAAEFDERSMRHVMLHELAHVRRGDLELNLVWLLLQALHWFNPVLWLAFRRMRADRELAADELSMAHLSPGEAQEFGATLIRALERGSGSRSPVVALGMVGGKACIRRRIRAVARYDAGRRGAWAVRGLLAGLLGLAFAGPAREETRNSSSPNPPETAPVTNFYRVEQRVRSAEELQERITAIRDAETRWISGEVVDESGSPIKEAKVVVAPFREPRLHRDVEVAGGRFEVAVLDSEERVVAIRAPGFAPRFLRRVGDRDRAPRRIELSQGRTVEGKVFDEDGAPLIWATLALQSDAGERMDDPLIRLEPTTDRNGRFQWAHAPLSSERLVAAAPGYEPAMVEILPSQPGPVEFRLRRVFELKIRVADEATGEAVEPTAVLVRWVPWGFQTLDDSQGWQRKEDHLRIETSPGEVRVQPNRRWNAVPGDLQLLIAATGYRPSRTEPIKLSGVQSLSVRLSKASPWRGRMLDPEGKAVPGGQIVAVGEGMVALDRGQLRALPGLGPLVVDADERGEFELPPSLPSIWVVAAHTNAGFAEITMMDLERTKEVRLRPWGRIEGALTSHQRAVEGVAMALQRTARSGPNGLDLTDYHAITDSRGRFRFDRVPPGSILLSRSWAMGGERGVQTMVPQKMIEVRAGETSEANLAATGRTVVGKVIVSPGVRPASSYFGHHGLFRKRALPPGPAAPRADHEAWARTTGPNATVEYPKVYPARWVGDDGRFVVENVPPGTFELRFGFMDWDAPDLRGLPRALGSVSKDVVVPEEAGRVRDEPMEVGILRVTLAAEGEDRR